MKILFLIPYPQAQAPSQRFRFEQYLDMLNQAGYVYHIQTFLTSYDWKHFSKSNMLMKSLVVVKGYLKRFLFLFTVPGYDRVFIHREATPIGPPIIEWIITKVFRKKIIYDFDDAIWFTDKTNEPVVEKVFRCRWKVSSICKWSYKISCGNEYLANYARQFNKYVLVNPTTIDTDQLHNPALYPKEDIEDSKITIGWTGSHSTLKYITKIEPVLNLLQQKYSTLNFLVIADRKPELQIERMEFIPWTKQTEVKNLMRMDIGIMPLPDDDWSKGKCGFKALQYMAMEIPCVASPVGVNTRIIEHGRNGYLANTENEWIEYLDNLIQYASLRKEYGVAGRAKVIKDYSVNSNASTFLSLFE